MKVKTSITLSEGLLASLHALIRDDPKSLSALIEEALQLFLLHHIRKEREERDFKILNERAEALNKEAKDVLSYQEEL